MRTCTHMLLGVVCGLTGLGPVQAADTLTPQQISTFWVGKTLVGNTASGAPVTFRINPDGSAEVRAGNTDDTGRWHLSDTGYCVTWKRLRGGKEGCLTVQRDGDLYMAYFADGQLSAKVRAE